MPTETARPSWKNIRKNPQFYPALGNEATLSTLPWHAFADSPKSSQAFCVSAFAGLGLLPTDVQTAVIRATIGNEGANEFGGPWKITLEHSDPFVLDEHGGQATSVDALLTSPTTVVAVESKFWVDAREGFGGCSQVKSGSCRGFFGVGSAIPAFARDARCVLDADVPHSDRTARRYWRLGRLYFQAQALASQPPDEKCPFLAGHFQLMRNFLYAAVMARGRDAREFRMLVLCPQRTSGRVEEQVEAFQGDILKPGFADRILFRPFEVFIDALRSTGDPEASSLAAFLESRIETVPRSDEGVLDVPASPIPRRPPPAAASNVEPPTRHRPIPHAPAAFAGSLRALFDAHIETVLPDATVVQRFHELFVEYLNAGDPLYIVRYLAGQERGTTIDIAGLRVRPSDNSPAWMLHRRLFDGRPLESVDDLGRVLNELPCHMHHIGRVPSVNTSGWHVAHILPAKNGDTDWRRWSREGVVRRFVRNLHPCNCFYLPKIDWQRFGGDPNVLAFAADVYRLRYGHIWTEFMALAGGTEIAPAHTAADAFEYAYGDSVPEGPTPAATATQASSASQAAGEDVVEYRATRLSFRRDVIEALEPHQRFRVVTRDHGTFEFTRAAFERVFDNVLRSESWLRDRNYNMASPPRKAEPFRVS